MNKDKLKEKVIKDKKLIFLSAQDYARLTRKEKKAMRDALVDENFDPDEYEEDMKKLWPKEFKPKPLTWRDR
jgi:hypothetical protein